MYTGLIEMQEGIDGGTEETEESEGDTDTTAPILSRELMVELRKQKNQKEILILQLQYFQR